jgi:hypothetical protein
LISHPKEKSHIPAEFIDLFEKNPELERSHESIKSGGTQAGKDGPDEHQKSRGFAPARIPARQHND